MDIRQFNKFFDHTILKPPTTEKQLQKVCEEATSMGAAITAGVGVGVYDDFDAAYKFINIAKKCYPDSEAHQKYDKMKVLFEEAYNVNKKLFDKLL